MRVLQRRLQPLPASWAYPGNTTVMCRTADVLQLFSAPALRVQLTRSFRLFLRLTHLALTFARRCWLQPFWCSCCGSLLEHARHGMGQTLYRLLRLAPLLPAALGMRQPVMQCAAVSNDCRVVRPAAVEKQSQHVSMALPGSPKGWRLARRILLVHIRAAVQQQLHHLDAFAMECRTRVHHHHVREVHRHSGAWSDLTERTSSTRSIVQW